MAPVDFAVDFRVDFRVDFFAADFFVADFLVADFSVADFFVADFLVVDFAARFVVFFVAMSVPCTRIPVRQIRCPVHAACTCCAA